MQAVEGLVELLQGVEQHHVADGLDHADAEYTGRCMVFLHQDAQPLHLQQHLGALLVHLLAHGAGLGRLDAAVEQFHTQRLLQVLHAARDGRLGEPQRVGSGADALVAHHGHEGADVLNFQKGFGVRHALSGAILSVSFQIQNL